MAFWSLHLASVSSGGRGSSEPFSPRFRGTVSHQGQVELFLNHWEGTKTRSPKPNQGDTQKGQPDYYGWEVRTADSGSGQQSHLKGHVWNLCFLTYRGRCKNISCLGPLWRLLKVHQHRVPATQNSWWDDCHDQAAVRGMKHMRVRTLVQWAASVLGSTGGPKAPTHHSVWLYFFSPVPGNLYLEIIITMSPLCCVCLKRWWQLGYQALFVKTKVTSDQWQCIFWPVWPGPLIWLEW